VGKDGSNPAEVLAHCRPGKADPNQVLEVLIKLFNTRHTALEKTVSFKTRKERAHFLRRFYRDLKVRAGFKILPDPRNLGDQHIRAIVKVWQQKKLAPATIQTYFSFLRGLALWLGKTGFIQSPAYYGMEPQEYKRTEVAHVDKSWTSAGVEIDGLIEKVCAFDRYVGASLKLIRTMGLRRKESIMIRPHQCVVPFEATGIDTKERQADRYVFIKAGAKGGRPRFIPLNTQERTDALEFARTVAVGKDSHMGDPRNGLRENLRRFDYVMFKFGITGKQLGITVHGLRHEVMINHYQDQAGAAPSVRSGGAVPPEKDAAARLSTAKLAGHNRIKASGAYLGPMIARREALPSHRRRENPKDTAE